MVILAQKFFCLKFAQKISSFFILCITVSPLVFGVALLLQQQWIKHEMKEALEKKQLTTIKIHQAELVWYEENEELLIAGEKFDVKEWNIDKNGIATLKGLFDKDEKKLDEVLATSMNKNNTTNLLWQKIFYSVYLEKEIHISNHSISCFIQKHLIKQDSQFSKGYLTIFTPPPQV